MILEKRPVKPVLSGASLAALVRRLSKWQGTVTPQVVSDFGGGLYHDQKRDLAEDLIGSIKPSDFSQLEIHRLKERTIEVLTATTLGFEFEIPSLQDPDHFKVGSRVKPKIQTEENGTGRVIRVITDSVDCERWAIIKTDDGKIVKQWLRNLESEIIADELPATMRKNEEILRESSSESFDQFKLSLIDKIQRAIDSDDLFIQENTALSVGCKVKVVVESQNSDVSKEGTSGTILEIIDGICRIAFDETRCEAWISTKDLQKFVPIRDTNLTAETIVQRACEIALKSTILTELNSTLLSEVVNELRAVGVLVNVRQDESYLVSPVGVTGVLAPELMAAYRDRSLYSSPPEMSPFPEIKPHVLMLEVASGCHYGTCTFCTMFNDVPAKSKSFDEFVDHHRKVMERIGSRRESIERIFLSGGDIFAVEPATLVEILNFVKSQHSGVRRVSAYARADLLITYGGFGFLDEFVSAGLGLVYIGGESGSGEIARQLNKGVTQRQLYLALSLAQEARLDVSLSLMLGPGGVKYSEAHIEETAQLLNQVFVRFISFRNVTADEGSIYQRDMVRSLARKTNRPLTPVETVLQLKTILQRLNPKGQRISMLGAGLDPIATNPMNLSVNFDKKGKAKALKLCDECLLLVDTPKGELSASKNSRFREVVLE